MGFFDLNVPFSDASSAPAKSARTKLAASAMELGYSGVAYNRTIKGVMSDRDRCSIPLLSLASLLKLSPSLASAMHFHRDLLGVPRAAPFRQYTRLTFLVDSPAQAQALNSGNPILKTYDLVAIRPLNQTVFDQACERLEVDIIAIDFSEKLPFRLKINMVKAAIQRGVYFEITYSGLLADIHSRRQMITNAKLLVDWTRGKNLIISSGALTAHDLRGPYDVANLSYLLGLPMERAKAAVSKNCSALIAKALRKKQFHKEAVKIELISEKNVDPDNKSVPGWDPLSSGEGDLLLEDLANSFRAVNKVSKNVKAIDFASVFDSNGSGGFQLNNVIPGATLASKSATSAPIATVIAKGASVLGGPKYVHKTKNQAVGSASSQILHPSSTKKGLSNDLKKCDNKANSANEKAGDPVLDILLDSPSGFDCKEDQTSAPSRDRDIPTPVEDDSSITSDVPEKSIGDYLMDKDFAEHDMECDRKPLPEKSQENEQLEQPRQDHDMECDGKHLAEKSQENEQLGQPRQDHDMECDGKHLYEKSQENEQLEQPKQDHDTECDGKHLSEKSQENEQLEETRQDSVRDQVPFQDSDAVRVEHDSSVPKDERQDATMEDQMHVKPDGEINRSGSFQSSPGKLRRKRKAGRQQALKLPLKCSLRNSLAFNKPLKTKTKKTRK